MSIVAVAILLACQQLGPEASGVAASRGKYKTSGLSPVAGATRTLSAPEHERLHVTWAEPRIGPGLFGEGSEQMITLSGTLELQSEDGKRREPVTWVQPINVGIVRQPVAQPTFDRGLPDRAFAIDDALVNQVEEFPFRSRKLKAGEFEARVPASAVHRGIGVEREFAVAISLGTLVNGQAKWTTDAPIVKGSIGNVKIPGQPRLSPPVQKINACGNGYGQRYDPKAAIRAANELRCLGRDGALRALEEYCKLAGTIERDPSRPTAPEEIDTADPSCLEYLVELVFGGLHTADDYESEVEVYRDIPFHRVYHFLISTSGPPIDYGEWVSRAAKQGKFVAARLRPPADPLAAVDEFCDALSARGRLKDEEWLTGIEKRGGVRGHLRRQAIRLLISDATCRALPVLDETSGNSDAAWRALRKSAAAIQFRWNDERQEYESAPK